MDLKKKRGHVTAELRKLAIRELRTGNVSQKQLAAELGVTTRTLRNWLRAAEAPENNASLETAERIQFEQLQRENERLREELEILKNFRAFSAKRNR